MKLNLKALAATTSILSCAAVFLVGVANLLWPPYGRNFLELLASLYPGYKAAGSLMDLIVGCLYALLDGLVFGLVIGWLYNFFTSS